MLRLQADRALPTTVRRDDWVALELSVRNESNGVPACPPDAGLHLAVTLLRDERHAVTGAPVLQVRARGGTLPARTAKTLPLLLDGRGHFDGEFKLLPTCTREHYAGDTHTPTCMHRIRRPVYLHVAVAASAWQAHPPTSFLPVTLGPIAVLEPGSATASGPAASTERLASSSPPPTPSSAALQRRTHTFRFGALTTLERPTAVMDGFGHVVWDAALLLVKWLESAPATLLAGQRTVEVGSGVGLVGLAAAALGAHVILTDMPDVLPLTRANVAANADLVRRSRGSAAAAPLVWGDSGHVAAVIAASSATASVRGRQPDLVLASDVVYQDALFAPLVATLAALAGPETTVLLAARERHGCDFDRFLDLLRAPFDVALAPLSGDVASLADACVLAKAKHAPHVYRLTRRRLV